MGFFKRFFSISSRKSKKNKQNDIDAQRADASGRVIRSAEPWQTEATRLLRSSSAHFSVVQELDIASLPPLPHPINNVVTPAVTPARSIASTLTRGTYNVTLLERTTHSRTEFPNANPSIVDLHKDVKPSQADLRNYNESPTKKKKTRPASEDVSLTPRDKKRVLRLSTDPDLANLFKVYDDKGRIRSTAFTNTPPNASPISQVGGREQIKRSGSTLRQLMGEPDSSLLADYSAMDGDISWAERELARIGDRTSMVSITSNASFLLEAHKDAHFYDSHSKSHVAANATFVSDDSHSDPPANWPAISSLEVELSDANPAAPAHAGDCARPSGQHESEDRTPRPASEVFGFVTERRKSILERNRSLTLGSTQNPSHLPSFTLAVPSATDRPLSTLSTLTATPNTSASPNHGDISYAQIHTATLTKLTPMSRSADSNNILYTPTTTSLLPQTSNTDPVPLSKIPRAPRPAAMYGDLPRHSRTPSQTSVISNTKEGAPLASLPSRIPKSSTLSQDPYTPMRVRRHQRRTASHASTIFAVEDGEEVNDDGESVVPPRSSRCHTPVFEDKENSPSSTQAVRSYVLNPLPAGKPLRKVRPRTHSRALFESRHPNFVNGEPPSPASSTDLSPLTRGIMSDLRKKKKSYEREQTRIPSGSEGRALKRL